MQSKISRRTKLIIIGMLLIFLAIPALFFVFTVSRAKPTAMELFLPKDSAGNAIQFNTKDPQHMLTLIAADKVYYYMGQTTSNPQVRASSYKDIRDVLILYKKELGDSLAVLIKPAKKGSYQSTVALLDEMLINDIKTYAMAEITDQEETLLVKQ
ncbi:MAG: biopolymer transporter ExbD [Chitinophagaceae bacterium]